MVLRSTRDAMALGKPITEIRSRLQPQGPHRPVDRIRPNDRFTTALLDQEPHTGFDDSRICPPALQEIPELNEYRVALVSPNRSAAVRGFTQFPPPADPAVLLPFSWRELLAGVSEFIRESTRLAERTAAQFADICVDFLKMEVSRVSGEVITLTNQEFKTLKCLLLNPGRVFSRDELLNEAWGYSHYPSTRTVDNHVLRLRQKLEPDPARPVHFLTVHSVGYKFVP